MSNGNGHHWSKFWWQDYLNDRELKLCSLAAQGLWMRLLCVMHDADGYLLVTGRIPSGRNLATILSVSERQIGRLLDELLQHGVARKTNDDVIYCQRMVNDIKASEAGKEFADKRWGGHKPNGSPTGPPNGQGTGEPNRQAYRDPNAKKLEAKSTPRSPPEGGARRRNSHPRNAAREMAREMDAQIAAASRTIDGNAKDVIEFNAFFQQRKAIAYG